MDFVEKKKTQEAKIYSILQAPINLDPIRGPPSSSARNVVPFGFPRPTAAWLEKEGAKKPGMDFEEKKTHDVKIYSILQSPINLDTIRGPPSRQLASLFPFGFPRPTAAELEEEAEREAGMDFEEETQEIKTNSILQSTINLDPVRGPPIPSTLDVFPVGFPRPAQLDKGEKEHAMDFEEKSEEVKPNSILQSTISLDPVRGPSSSALDVFHVGFPRPVQPETEGEKEHAMGFEEDKKMQKVQTNSILQLGNADDVMERDVDLEDIVSSLSDAQSEIRRVEKNWLAREIAMRDERNALKAALDDETGRLTDTKFALEEQITKVAALEGERDAALVAAKKARERARQKTHRILQAFDAIVIALHVQQRKSEAEFKREANVQLMSRRIEQAKFLFEYHYAQTKLEHEKKKFDIELESAMIEKRKAEELLETVIGQRDEFKRERDDAALALDEQKAKVVAECDAKLKLMKLLDAERCKKKRLEYDLIVAGEEVAEEKMKMEQAHKTEMAQARNESRKLKVKLLEAASQKTKLEAELIRLREKCSDLDSARKAAQNNLEEEREKSLCQICFESPKNSIAFPCLHLNFCFSCLESHRAQKKTCPTCRTTISGVLKCIICL